MDEVSSLYADATPEHPLEVSLLTQLSLNPHPNITEMVTSFIANTSEQHELFTQQMNPDNPKKIYTTARAANFMVLKSPRVNLETHLETMKRTAKALHTDVFPEVMVLSVLSQVLLAVGHLVNNQIAHCAVSLCNLFLDERDGDHIVLTNFSRAVQLDSQKQNLERVRQMHSRLKAEIGSNLRRGHCMLSPEVVEAVDNSELDDAFLQGELKQKFAKSDTFSAAWMIYSWFLDSSHSFIQQDMIKPYLYRDIPFLSELSPQCNHLLKKLVAYDSEERLSPVEGAIACFVLLFGPNVSTVNTEEECYKWLLAETVEFYMRPVLVDSKVRDYTDSFAKLLCVYLTVASSNPRAVWDACKFFSKCTA
jgi:serine/threonine protein kinase